MVTRRPYLVDEDGNTLGEIFQYDDRRPTEKSAKQHGWPAPGGAESERLAVACGKTVLISAHGTEPARLFGLFVSRELRLKESQVIAPRPDLESVGLKSPVVADHDRPLQVWCPYHKRGHDIDPSRLRAAIRDADRASRRRGKGRPPCPVGRVECSGDADVGV